MRPSRGELDPGPSGIGLRAPPSRRDLRLGPAQRDLKHCPAPARARPPHSLAEPDTPPAGPAPRPGLPAPPPLPGLTAQPGLRPRFSQVLVRGRASELSGSTGVPSRHGVGRVERGRSRGTGYRVWEGQEGRRVDGRGDPEKGREPGARLGTSWGLLGVTEMAIFPSSPSGDPAPLTGVAGACSQAETLLKLWGAHSFGFPPDMAPQRRSQAPIQGHTAPGSTEPGRRPIGQNPSALCHVVTTA